MREFCVCGNDIKEAFWVDCCKKEGSTEEIRIQMLVHLLDDGTYDCSPVFEEAAKMLNCDYDDVLLCSFTPQYFEYEVDNCGAVCCTCGGWI